MSYLAVSSFDDDFTTVDIGMRVTSLVMIKAIRFKMFKHGTIADGTLTLQVLNEDDTVIGTKAITAAELNTGIPATYAHGYLNFQFDEQVCINKDEGDDYIELTLRLTMSGHTEDTSNYVALVRQFEGEFVDEYGSRPTADSPEMDGWFNPYGVEIYGIQ